MCGPMMALAGIGAATGIAGTIIGGMNQSRAAKDQARLAMRQGNAEAASYANEIDNERRSHAQLMGEQEAAIGASGVDASSTSMQDVRMSSDREHARTIGKLRWSAQTARQNRKMEAQTYRQQAKDIKTASYFNAAATGLNAASGVAGSSIGRAEAGRAGTYLGSVFS